MVTSTKTFETMETSFHPPPVPLSASYNVPIAWWTTKRRPHSSRTTPSLRRPRNPYSINHNHSKSNNNYSNNSNFNNNNNNTGNPTSYGLFASALPNFFTQPSIRSTESAAPTRVMFLISDTGGGHRASAQALAAAFEELYPGQVDSLIIDFWTEIVGRPFGHFPEGYSFLAKNPPLWRAAWNYGRFPITRYLTEEFANAVGHNNFRKAISEFQPHLIVSVHPLTQFIPVRVLRTLPTPLPFVTVCTDLGGAHPTWFHRDVDLCFVPSDRVRAIAQRCGLKDIQLRQFGLPVRSDFWHESRDKVLVRSTLGLSQTCPVILVVGGGDGVGGVGRIAVSLAHRIDEQLGGMGAQVVVICGKNKRLQEELKKRNWPIPVVVKGFVNNMSEWMAASDLIVSKAGPGTIAEALIRGLPIVLSGYLPGQEAPNVKYVTDAGVGAFSRDPQTIAEIVTDWVSDPTELEERSKMAKSLGTPNATHDIVREMAKLIHLESSSPTVEASMA